jgi:hypothetical protein
VPYQLQDIKGFVSIEEKYFVENVTAVASDMVCLSSIISTD